MVGAVHGGLVRAMMGAMIARVGSSTSPKPLPLTSRFDERDVVDGAVVLGRSVAHDGSILLITSTDRPPTTHYEVIRIKLWGEGKSVDRVKIRLVDAMTLHHVQVVKDLLVLASGRARSVGGQPLPNAIVVGAEGAVIRSFSIGDGVEDLQASSAGDVWAAYFDEGALDKNASGSAGLIKWSILGEKLWKFQAPAGLDPIVDCNALNIDGLRDVWISYYTSFPLVHVCDGHVVGRWAGAPRGTHAFAVHGDYSLFQGGYASESWLYLCKTHEETLRVESSLEPRSGSGSMIGMRGFGRGSILWLVANGQWYRVDLKELLA